MATAESKSKRTHLHFQPLNLPLHHRNLPQLPLRFLPHLRQFRLHGPKLGGGILAIFADDSGALDGEFFVTERVVAVSTEEGEFGVEFGDEGGFLFHG